MSYKMHYFFQKVKAKVYIFALSSAPEVNLWLHLYYFCG